MRKGSRYSRFKKGRAHLATLGIALLAGVVVSQYAPAPFLSAEVKFADSSASGLQIMPASCPSSPHWTGECDLVGCSVSVSPNNFQSGSVSSVTVQWETGAPPNYASDSAVASIAGTLTGVGAVYPSGTLNVSAPASSVTYTYSGGYYGTGGNLLDTFSCSAPVTVTNPPVISLSKNLVELYRAPGDIVHPGDIITYRVYVQNTGNTDQTGLAVYDDIPANTTLSWQGGGMANNSCGSGTCVQGGSVWWTNPTAPVGQEFYVDFSTQVNLNAADGSMICNNARVGSSQLAMQNTAVLCNPVAVCTTVLSPQTALPNTTSGKRVNTNTPPICITNFSGNTYFIPTGSSGEMTSFKNAVSSQTVPGAMYNVIQ